jgi:hypothetical protein
MVVHKFLPSGLSLIVNFSIYIHFDTAEWLDQNNIYYRAVEKRPVSLVYIPVAQWALVFTLGGKHK